MANPVIDDIAAGPSVEAYHTTFKPRSGEEWYYKIKTPALFNESPLYTTLVQPWVPPKDPTHGRYDLPYSPREDEIRNDTQRYNTWSGKVHMKGSERDWIAYQVWDPKEKSVNADLVFCHGINDYGGKFSEHAKHFLNAGYRIILPDLPSHGRSTGLHAYVTRMESLAEAVDAVICEVALTDEKHGKTPEEVDSRKRFIAGASMGGFTALLYTIQYPPAPVSEAAATSGIRNPLNGLKRPKIHGAMLLCPMLEIAPESRPSWLVEHFARGIASFAGRFPLAEANRGKNTDRPALEQEFEQDPQTYNGKLRIATGLAILKGIEMVNTRLHEVNLPFKVFHGTGDRVTNPRGSQRLFDQCSSKDKEIQLYEGYQHVMLARGLNGEDDAPRQRVLNDMLDWLNKHL
ncbi:alpha/beta-hydrolase [Cystobasidium minutum MCA 4210]|uniref:alpha/beta-hydrolase n=1 Tax=Cystobasidium minutum MCA 4210 TaxID=1397322 RepID=UPI0034CD6C8D|eukprot:jgi/Rhomi1/209700/estExt_Genemark1.C_3_t10345